MKTRRSYLSNYSVTSLTKTKDARLLATLRLFSARLHERVNRAKLKLLARQAKRLGVLPLLIEVVRIERGLQSGWWFVDKGRLWVCVE